MGQGRLAGKIALITGGARGQGAAEARLFSSEGAHVIIVDILENEGRALAAEIVARGYRATFHRLDVADAGDWERLTTSLDVLKPGLDILINNAGINIRQQLTSMSTEDWERLIAVNLTGPMLGIKACVPLMRRRGGGAIVNVGSLAGLMGHPTTGYSAAKWGLRGLTKSAALELAQWNIRVNAMHPGLVDTPIIDRSSPFYAALREMTPLRRAGTPEELARVALFLASDDSSFMTGVDIPVDGGLREFGTYSEVWRRAMAAAAGRAADQAGER
jgi:NAD(P)-dependent dehydrogenase (short-subunit alcohol dehydrogenase family)